MTSTIRRTLGTTALAAAGFVTLVATGGGGGGDGGAGPTGVLGTTNCAVSVASGFAGDVDWSTSGGAVGAGADGKGGVGIGVGLGVGPVRGARVTVRGADGAALGSAATGEDGRVTFTPCERTGPFRIEVAGADGATHVEHARDPAGVPVPFGAGQSLRAHVASIGGNLAVTPLTEAASRLLDGGTPSIGERAVPAAADIDAANARIAALAAARWPAGFAPSDIVRMPALVSVAAPLLIDTPAARHALALAALGGHAAVHAPSLAAPSLAAAQQLATDATDARIDGVGASGAPISPAAERAYDASRLSTGFASALALATRRHADPTLLERLPAVLAVGAVGLPDGGGAGVPTAVRLRRDGTLHRVDAAGADVERLAADVSALQSASQRPPTALFVQGEGGGFRALGYDGPAGLLGAGSTAGSRTPVAIAPLRAASGVSIGLEHALARRDDGTVLGWGVGTRGQLAAAGSTLAIQPVGGIGDALAVLAIADLSFALRLDGTVWAWGSGAGALGGGATAPALRTEPAPVRIDADRALDRVVALAAFVGTTGTPDATLAALRADGSVWTWGDNASGGLGTGGASRGAAAAVPGIARIVQVVASDAGFVALDEDGAVFVWGRAGGATTPLPPTRVQGLPPVQSLADSFAGLYQVRAVARDGQRWRLDGLGAAQIDDASEFDVRPLAAGIATIATVAGDDAINAAERTAGVVVSGTVSEANRPVTVRAGGATRVVTSSGTTWTTTFAAADWPTSGSVAVTASFTTVAGATSGVARRTVSVDAAAPTVSVAGAAAPSAGAPVTFTFTWNEPVTGFVASDVELSPGNAVRGAFVAVSASVYRLSVTPPANTVGTLVATVPAGAATDLAGNANAAPASGGQAFSESVPPTLAIVAEPAEVLTLGTRFPFRFDWSEPVVGFAADDVAASVGTKGALVQIGPTSYRMAVDVAEPNGNLPGPYAPLSTVVSVAAGRATDAGGNPNPGPVSASSAQSQPYDVSFDAASPGTGGGADGSAGDAGGPGFQPGAVPVQAQVVGNALRMTWNNHPVSQKVSYYQVLVRDNPTALAYTFGPRIPAIHPSYAVNLPRLPAERSYALRACRTDMGQSGPWGCRDFGETRTDAAPFTYAPVVASLFAGEDQPQVALGRPGVRITFSVSWSQAVTGFTAADVSVTVGTVVQVAAIGPLAHRIVVDLVQPPYPSGLATTVRIAQNAVTGASGTSNRLTEFALPRTGFFNVFWSTRVPGTGEGPSGSAGTAGAPGVPPPAFDTATTTVADGNLLGTVTLRWRGAPPASKVMFYQVLTRQTAAAPWLPVGDRIPALYDFYSAEMNASPATRSYRIRACNTEPASPGGPFLTNGFNGCRDSADFGVGVSRIY